MFHTIPFKPALLPKCEGPQGVNPSLACLSDELRRAREAQYASRTDLSACTTELGMHDPNNSAFSIPLQTQENSLPAPAGIEPVPSQQPQRDSGLQPGSSQCPLNIPEIHMAKSSGWIPAAVYVCVGA